jgi:hypothetical protein
MICLLNSVVNQHELLHPIVLSVRNAVRGHAVIANDLYRVLKVNGTERCVTVIIHRYLNLTRNMIVL